MEAALQLAWTAITNLDSVRSYDWQNEVARRLQIELVERKAAEVDGMKAETASKLLPALEGHDQAVIMLGRIIIVKHFDKLVVKTIDAVTAAKIERSETLLSDPEAVLRVIATVRAEHPNEYPALTQRLSQQVEGEEEGR